MSTTRQQLEIEIKLKLESFADYLKLVGYIGAPDVVHEQNNCFFDSEDRQLQSRGWALRVRVEDDRGLVTLKSAADAVGDNMAVIRKEIEAEVSRETARSIASLEEDILSLQIEPVTFLHNSFPKIRLARLVEFRNIRHRKRHRFGDYHYDLLLDKTEFSDGSCDYELELEIDHPQQEELVLPALQKLFSSLDIPFERQAETKLARALARSGLS